MLFFINISRYIFLQRNNVLFGSRSLITYIVWVFVLGSPYRVGSTDYQHPVKLLSSIFVSVRYPQTLFWIGGRNWEYDRANWVTCQSLKYNRWPQGVSTNTARTKCIALDGNYNFMWEAFSCDSHMHFICEER